MGPESYALNIPVVTQEPPILFVDTIIVHGQDVQILNPILMDPPDNNDNLTSAAILDSENKSLSMQVSSFDGGDLQIKMPKAILDAITEGGNVTDAKLTVLVDGLKTEYKETTLPQPRKVMIDEGQQQQLPQKDTIREISVFIPKGDKKVEIIGKDIS
jgi:hypothetical protein